ncbi:MAG: lipid-A-disaccharide synthase [Myxococcales bacterium]|nr:lipid-A-disaccharide synthase [Myxococcales bacterium]
MSAPRGPLLVVAGEASGDLAAAPVVRRRADAFGMGGDALRAAGCEIVADVRDSTAMGLGGVSARALGILRAWRSITREARRRRPAAALLVNYTEFNIRLARELRRLGTRVVFYGAPQVWAWRPGRARHIAPLVDHMAVMFPFEEALWRAAGAPTTWVGHHALEAPRPPRAAARDRLGLSTHAEAVAILPGSRPHEVRRLLPPMLAALADVRAARGTVEARVLLAPSLDRATAASATAQAARAGVEAVLAGSSGIAAHLAAFDVALTASGTASLECVISGTPPVIAYRVDLVTELAARALLKTPHVGLPNIVLGRRAFAELLQRDATAARMAEEVSRVLDAPEAARADAAEVVRRLTREGPPPSARVADLLTGSSGPDATRGAPRAAVDARP